MKINGQVFRCSHCGGCLIDKVDLKEKHCFVRNNELLVACVNCGRRYCLRYVREEEKIEMTYLY